MQEILALAKVHVAMNRDTNPYPLLLPTAHYKLAQVGAPCCQGAGAVGSRSNIIYTSKSKLSKLTPILLSHA